MGVQQMPDSSMDQLDAPPPQTSTIAAQSLKDCHLVLFLSRATPLQTWENAGILSRELALYRRLQPYLGGITFISSGGASEKKYEAILGGIQILYNQWHIPPNIYSLIAPWLHGRSLRKATVYKTNQLDGAWTAIISGSIYRKLVIVRAGYLWADFGTESSYSKWSYRNWKAMIKQLFQRFALKGASAVVLTTDAMKRKILNDHSISPKKVFVFPNYVDTDLFHPMAEVEKIPGRICFVGRLEPQKNLHALIEAVASIPGAFLVCFGDGSEQEELATLAKQLKVRVDFQGRVSNEQLPVEINRSEVFVLPSFYEGHPKSLLEAMACGAAVVGTKVAGIQEVINDGETGLLCETSSSDIARVLTQLLQDSTLRDQLGSAVSAFARQEYSLNSVLQKELALLQQLVTAETI